MGLFGNHDKKLITTSKYQMMIDNGGGFYSFSGKTYNSDIVRASIRPKSQAVGKSVGKHFRKNKDGLAVNPEPYIKFLLEEPNPLMSGQMLQEKLTVQLMLNNNAFALIQRDDNGFATGIYPIDSCNVEALQDKAGSLFLKFIYQNGKEYIFKYTDIIHLRRDFYDNQIFGSSPHESLKNLMEVVNTTDQGIIKAIKNSNVIKWLLKFNQTLREEDLKRHTKAFVESYLNVESDTVGAASTDSKFDAKQVEPKSYVPNAEQMIQTKQRINEFFNTNENITQSSFNENEWLSYYEAEIEPLLVQMSNEYTRKLFTRKERSFGNRIIFESSNLSFASMQTKINLVQFVDRGILSPNEVREIMNYAPTEHGDEFIRRLDTAPAKGGEIIESED